MKWIKSSPRTQTSCKAIEEFLSTLMCPRWWTQTSHFSSHFLTSEFWRVCFARGSYTSWEEHSLISLSLLSIWWHWTLRPVLGSCKADGCWRNLPPSILAPHHANKSPTPTSFPDSKGVMSWTDNRSGQSHSACEDFWSEDDKSYLKGKMKRVSCNTKEMLNPECDDEYLQISSSNMESKVSYPHWETLHVWHMCLKALKSLSL